MIPTRLLCTALLALSTSLGLAEAPARSDKAKSIFDGKSLDGWESPSPNLWAVKDGCLTGGDGNKIPYNDFLCTKGSYSNFVLHLKIKLTGDPKTGLINSGVQIRTKRNPTGHEVCGYQCDYGEPNWYAGIYDEGRRNKFIAPADMAVIKPAVKLWDWNEYVIKADGKRIQTWINGVQGIDFMEPDADIASDGIIGFQVHGGGNTTVQVKDVFIEELPATSGAPTWESLGGVEGQRAKISNLRSRISNPKAADAKPTTKRDISYNDVKGTALTAEEEMKKFHLPEGYEVELVLKESDGIGKFVSVSFDQRGRLWTQTALEYPLDANENPAAAEAVYAAKSKDKVLVYSREELNALPAGGLQKPTVFADGLAIPLGLLPWGNGDSAYILHGHDILLYKDTDGDGKADKSDVMLTGFGVQDSHLFPHQFTRAPGGWIWMAQGAFNNGTVLDKSGKMTEFPSTRMARFRPDGTGFEITSQGPCNIWGLVMTGEGETFIQEANDYGYPVMPFHEYANYPGCADRLFKSYAPHFPVQAPDFKMGGTGLSGLALGEGEFRKLTPSVKDDGLCMFVANPIISKVQTLAMHREDSRKMPREAPSGWRLEQATDLLTSDDPFFRPVGMTQGPDGCLYIVDWYNKIISHNEVARNHPDRDKIRGRIWRIKPKAEKRTEIADFTKLSAEELIAMLGTQPTARAHIAWQTIIDRKLVDLAPKLKALIPPFWVCDFGQEGKPQSKPNFSKAIQALWAIEGIGKADAELLIPLLNQDKKCMRREAISSIGRSSKLQVLKDPKTEALHFDFLLDLPKSGYSGPPPDLLANLGKIKDDQQFEVRAESIRVAAAAIGTCDEHTNSHLKQGKATSEILDVTKSSLVAFLLSTVHPSLPGPTAASRAGKQIPVGEAYDREFERYLVRMFLEQHPDVVAKFLDTPEAAKLPVEARVLASLALEPKASASRVAKLLTQLDRAPNDEELLRLAQFPEEAGCGDALKALLSKAESRAAVADKLLAQKTKLDPKKISPLLNEAAKALLGGKDDERALGVSLVGGFQLASLEADLIAMARSGVRPAAERTSPDKSVAPGSPSTTSSSAAGSSPLLPALQALRELRSGATDLFADLSKSADAMIRDEALGALAASKNPDAADKLFALYPALNTAQQRAALNALSSTKTGAKAIVAAIADKRIPSTDLDGPTAERLSIVLGDDAELNKLMATLGHVFHNVLAFDGSDDAWVDSKITLDGPFTVETWVRLAEGMSNKDDVIGVPGGVEMNFHQSRFRVFAGPALHDVVVAKKPMTPDLWTHIAVTRDAKGIIKIYQNGEFDAASTVAAPAKWENCRIGWSGPKGGTKGMMTEFRVWNRERTASELRANFDRVIETSEGMKRYDDAWGKLSKGTRIAKTTDIPPLLTKEQAEKLDTQFAHYSELGQKKGNIEKGKALSAICLACHTIGATGGQIGPNLSGAGAMGLEGVLRNIMTPNAAMEAGYRTFRVELKSGDIVDSFFVNEDKQAFVVRQPGVQDRRIEKKDVRSTRYIRRSLMPEGLLDALNDEQVTDLLSYLMTLKG
jgi:putative heme-binding domain-containing protein